MKNAPFTVGRALVAVILILLLLATAFGVYRYSAEITGTPISLPGKIAMGIGVLVTLGLGGGLMALSFYSARSGRDEDAQYQPNKKKGDR
jgi:hypothetical protein